MRKILFPFEINDPIYQEAYLYAVKIARNMNAEMILLNTFEIEKDFSLTKTDYDKLIRSKWIVAYNNVVKLNKHYIQNSARIDTDLKIKFDHRFIQGNQLNCIKEIISTEKIDLIVLPLYEKESENKKQIQIIRDDVFEKVKTSLLVIPFNHKYHKISNIIFSTDLRRLNYPAVYLNDTINFAKTFNSNIHFIYVSNGDDTDLSEKNDLYKTIIEITRLKTSFTFHKVIDKSISHGINTYAKSNNIDLLIVIKHEKTLWDTLFRKSISEETIQKSNLPVLIMREKND